MPKLPIISGKRLLKALKKYGYQVIRQKGSHVFVEDTENEKGTVIPIHGDEDLGKGLLKSIMNDLDLSAEEIIKMIK